MTTDRQKKVNKNNGVEKIALGESIGWVWHHSQNRKPILSYLLSLQFYHVPMPTLTIIDGSGFVHRAFYALPPLNTPDGVTTGAVMGFANMILRWQDQNTPTHGVIVFDHGKSAFRQNLYPEYKAHRPPTPPDLSAQFPIIQEFCAHMDISCISKPGIEADDLIASITHQGLSMGWDIHIVTSDKDLLQLSKPGVSLYDPMKNRILDADAVATLWGVRPDQIPHVQALAGDTADGIPGIPGVGIKTATHWIQTFGSVQGLIDHAHQLPSPKKRDLVAEYADQARMCYQLTLLNHTFWDDEWDLKNWVWARHPKAQALHDFVTRFHLKILGNRLRERGVMTSAASESSQIDMAKANAHSMSDLMIPQSFPDIPYVCDHEQSITDHILETGKVALIAENDGIVACWNEGQCAVIRTDQLIRIWQDPSCIKIVHDAKWWLHHNIQQARLMGPFDDLMLLSYIINGTKVKHDLASIFNRFGWTTVLSDGNASQKARAMLVVWEKNRLELREKQLMRTYEWMDRPLIPVIAAMEHAGISIDMDGLERLEKTWETEAKQLSDQIMVLAGQTFNLASPKQLGKVLFEDLYWPNGKKGKSGSYHTDSDVLSRFAAMGYPLAELVLEWRQLSKLIHTYAKGLRAHIHPETRRIHTTYNTTTTSTGRLSSLEPNVQNIPIRTERGRLLRAQFKAPQGYMFLCLDYSQIELRLLAHMGPIASLQWAFQNNLDIHTQTACQLFHCEDHSVTPDMRRTAKGINFGILYGISAFGLAEHLRIDRIMAKTMIERYFNAYPEISDYLERTKQRARENGYVTTLWGRRCMISGADHAKAFVRSGAERQAINAPLQGTSADIIKRAMIMTHKWILENPDYDVSLVMQIHDELVFQVPHNHVIPVRDHLIPLMQDVVTLSVPLLVTSSVGPTLDQ